MLSDSRFVSYAVDDEGNYSLVQSLGWDPANVALAQLTEMHEARLSEAKEKVRRGEESPIAYFMAANRMDERILADYVGLARWRVRRHMRPAVFTRLKRGLLEKYAGVFRVTVEELQRGGRLPSHA